MATVTIPGVGPVDAKYVWAGGALVAGIVGYSYWRRSGTTDAADVDQLPDDAAGPDVGDGWGNVPGRTGDTSGGWVPDGTRDPATAAEWTQEAVERMTNIGYDGQAVAMAIGKWLGRQGLTADQADMIRVVKALMPAVPGYPEEPPITIGLPPTPGTGTPPPGGGGGTGPGRPLLHHVLRAGKGRVTLQWNQVPNVTGYALGYTGGPSGGVRLGASHRQWTLTGLPAGRREFWVEAVNASGRTKSNVVAQTVQ